MLIGRRASEAFCVKGTIQDGISIAEPNERTTEDRKLQLGVIVVEVRKASRLLQAVQRLVESFLVI